MKTLYLIRHAKSSWENPGLKDMKRPLNSRGEKDAPKMGKLLEKQKDIPDLIISSPAKRALDTARKIAKEVNYPLKKIIIEKKLYMAEQNDFISVIEKVKKSVNSLMIISHNFGLTLFANYISGIDVINIPTAGIVRIDFEIKKWKEINQTKGKLVFFEYPKKNTGKN
jgi:phosphohistidine phosphatase